MTNKKYKAQALAIAMIVLVVCSIIGISIYSRVSKDKTLTIEEQASSEALEVADLIIDYVIQAPVEEVVDKFPEGIYIGNTITDHEIQQFLDLVGVNGEALSAGICLPGENGNEHYLKIQEADENTYFEIRPGQVKSFVVKDLNPGSGCSTTISLDIRGENQVGFDVTKIYSDSAGNIKEYETTDAEQYCFANDAGTCYNNYFAGGNWNPYPSETPSPITLTETVSYEGTTYSLDEVRIKAVGGTVAIAQDLDDSTCTDLDGLRMIQITAGANCNGVYRAKEIIIPENKWHSTIFDYVIFNGEGSI